MAFAVNPENHDFVSPNSLHDSWLVHWNVSEQLAGEKKQRRSIQIDVCLLGSRHDRHIILKYGNVRSHSIARAETDTLGGHGDLLVHELRLMREGLFAHEILFSRGTVFLVEFRDFEHRVELLS